MFKYFKSILLSIADVLSYPIYFLLYTAIERDSAWAVWAISFFPIDFNRGRSYYGETPLQHAARNGSLSALLELLKIPEVLNNAHANRNWAIYRATVGGHLSIVQEFLKIEAVRNNMDAITCDISTCAAECLFIAVANKHWSVVQELIQIDEVRNSAQESYEFVLGMALDHGDLFLVQELLKIDGVRNIADHSDNVLLHMRAIESDWPMVQELLKISSVRNNIRFNGDRFLYLIMKSWDSSSPCPLSIAYMVIKTIFPQHYSSIPSENMEFITEHPLFKAVMRLEKTLTFKFMKFFYNSTPPAFSRETLNSEYYSGELPPPVVFSFAYHITRELNDPELADIAIDAARSNWAPNLRKRRLAIGG